MKYIDQVPKTVYTDIEIEVKDGVSYFHTWNEDNEPEDYYRLNIIKDLRFDTLYNIAITKIRNYEDDFSIRWWEVSDDCLPFGLRSYFSGENKIEIITEERFNEIKQKVLNKLEINQYDEIQLTEVYNTVRFVTRDGEELAITMRD